MVSNVGNDAQYNHPWRIPGICARACPAPRSRRFGKHHRQHQEFLQSKQYSKNLASCSDCRWAHAGKKPMIVAKDTCNVSCE